MRRKWDTIAEFLSTKLNEVFVIGNKEILESLQINYWILFLKDFVFTESLNLE